MAISNLETIIDNIEQMIETVHADNRGKIMLPKDTLRQLLGELKASVPDEIKKFSKKTKELEESKAKELEQARHNAERIMNEANAMRDRLLDENVQVKMAEEKANQIINEANTKAREMISQAEMYISQIQNKSVREYDDSLAFMISYLQNIGTEISNTVNVQFQNLTNKLNELNNKRNELQKSIQMRNERTNFS